MVAGRRAHHRQEHHPLPLPVLAGDADERRPAAAAPGLRPRLHARQGRQDEQDAGQRARSGRDGRAVRRRRRALHGPARGAVRPRRGRLVRRLHAPLQRRPGQRLRQPAQPDAEHDRPLPRRRARPAAERRLASLGRRVGRDVGRGTTERWTGYLLHDALARAVGLRRRGQPVRRPRAAVDAGQAGEGRRRRRCRAAARRARRPAGGLPRGCAGRGAVHARRGARRQRAAGPRLRLRTHRRQRRHRRWRKPWGGERRRAARSERPRSSFPRVEHVGTAIR